MADSLMIQALAFIFGLEAGHMLGHTPIVP
jgi:hypothetical protein